MLIDNTSNNDVVAPAGDHGRHAQDKRAGAVQRVRVARELQAVLPPDDHVRHGRAAAADRRHP
eukprot:7935917-Pyramimonas_sp.AAC.1